ncbi:PREDICTED: cytochrome P450 26A1-like [Priapulus caudatus]|uniref:Cytochrome P450 26A1-like n=1 Tax=Priapulus caudatus TaxID=37621 RepID=A0ABM1DN93_PRICU|nr:PREDICTED: cytochrome P450 26A1-like [Priapulus caudatus]
MLIEILLVCLSAAVPLMLCLATLHLWRLHVNASRDRACGLPLPPGTYGVPFIGETAHFAIWGAEFYKCRREAFGHVYKTHILGQPTIRVIGADNVAKVLRGEGTLVTSKWPASVRMLLGDGLVSAEGDTLRRRRRAVMRAFDATSLASYVPGIEEVAADVVQQCLDADDVVLLQPKIKEMTFRVAADCLLGIDFRGSELSEWAALYQNVLNNLFSLPVKIPGLGLYKALKSRDQLFVKMDTLIDRELEHLTSGTDHIPNGKAFSRLVTAWHADAASESGISREELKFAIFEMLLLGHETTSSACSMLAMQLYKNPKALGKVRQELEDFGLTDPEAPLKLPLINKLDYVNSCVKEVLRILPPTGGGYRRVLQTFEINGFQIPKDWTVIYSIRDTHEVQDTSPRPDVFCPDRWTNGGGAATSKTTDYSYIPFGAGARACIGREFAKLVMKVFCVQLARSCSYRLLNADGALRLLPVPAARDDMPATFMSRSDVNNNVTISC